MIDLYTHRTPNGYKISICLEELGIPYSVKEVNVSQGEQFKQEFVALNPNAKVPVIVDHETGQTVFESCAILLYLADKAGKLVPSSGKARMEAIQWLFFQAASIGPMFGQKIHFDFYAPEKIPYAIERYTKESERLYEVIEGRLANREYICDEYSIVDIAHFGWIHTVKHFIGINAEQFPKLTAWYDQIAARPAAAKGVTIPAPLPS
jgi:GSH-dependent disulfide-bond oxidoreductase